jgi:hypothetical protein
MTALDAIVFLAAGCACFCIAIGILLRKIP